MAKISDIVKLKSGYANFVELKSAFAEAQENAERMAMYRPTRSHRQAFERICRGVYQPSDKKFYLLSGSYGTGKSHLCLMTANFLSRSSGDPEIAGFYANYAGLDAETARMLKNIRKDGQYLVAICDYYSGKRFEGINGDNPILFLSRRKMYQKEINENKSTKSSQNLTSILNNP